MIGSVELNIGEHCCSETNTYNPNVDAHAVYEKGVWGYAASRVWKRQHITCLTDN